MLLSKKLRKKQNPRSLCLISEFASMVSIFKMAKSLLPQWDHRVWFRALVVINRFYVTGSIHCLSRLQLMYVPVGC